jgi:dolichol-phosphate mannosyltransferase
MITATAMMREAAPSLVPAQIWNSVTTVQAPELSLVIPTFNERANIGIVVERVAKTLEGVNWEIIFVDDNSPDGTAAAARAIGAEDPRVRCIRRVGRRGLSGACIEGMLASQAVFVGVMDADLQHDESALLPMLEALRQGHDLVIGSRYVGDGTADAGFTKARLASSHFATKLANRVLGIEVSDPMSGFFMLRRDVVNDVAPQLATEGFKILADILASARGRLRVSEVPYGFRARQHGESKLDSQVALDFLGLLVSKLTRNVVPVRFASFVLVGALGIVVHLLVLKAGLSALTLDFAHAQVLATFVAMTTNFWLNNRLTYRDGRLKGVAAIRGLVIFYMICAVGALSNIGVATWLYSSQSHPSWWIAGFLGSVIGAVWNYALSNTLVWRR